MKCPKCGAELARFSLACKKCQNAITGAMEPSGKQKESKESGKNLASRARLEFFKKPKKDTEAEESKDRHLIVSYLICPPYQPVKLEREKTFFIGREESNQLVLPSPNVSRSHASVKWENGAYVIRDEDSVNGVFLNDDYVEAHFLEDSDKIIVGPYTILYREVLREMTLEKEIDNDSLKKTIRMNISRPTASANRSSSLKGDIKSMGLPPVLQMLGFDGKSGCLKVTDGKDTGLIYFLEGTVVHSCYKELSGKDAFFYILGWEKGKFTFSHSQAAEEITMSERIDWLLLEWARVIDEDNAEK